MKAAAAEPEDRTVTVAEWNLMNLKISGPRYKYLPLRLSVIEIYVIEI